MMSLPFRFFNSGGFLGITFCIFSQTLWATGCGDRLEGAHFIHSSQGQRKKQRLLELSSLISKWGAMARELSSSRADLADRAKNTFMMNVLKEASLIPVNGKIHVIGPGANHYEWVVPLMARPDARITVSDPSYFEGFMTWGKNPEQKEEFLRGVYAEVAKNNPDLFSYKDSAGAEQFTKEEEFMQAIRNRVEFIPRAEDAKDKADFILSIAPHSGMYMEGFDRYTILERFQKTSHSDSVIWTVADERISGAYFDDDFYQVELPRVNRLSTWFFDNNQTRLVPNAPTITGDSQGNVHFGPQQALPGSYLGNSFGDVPILMIPHN